MNEIYVLDSEASRWEESDMLFVAYDPVQRERDEDDQVPDVWIQRIRGKAELQKKVNNNRFIQNPEDCCTPMESAC